MKRSSKPGYTSTKSRNTVYPIGHRSDNTVYLVGSKSVYPVNTTSTVTRLDNIVNNSKPMNTRSDNKVYNTQLVYKGLSKILSKEPVYRSGLETKINPLEQARRAYANGISPITDTTGVLLDCHRCYRRMTSCICYVRQK